MPAQVLRLQLDTGHHHSCICMAQLQVPPGDPTKPRRPFLILASHLVFQDAGLQQLQGLLSFFELVINPETSRCAPQSLGRQLLGARSLLAIALQTAAWEIVRSFAD